MTVALGLKEGPSILLLDLYEAFKRPARRCFSVERRVCRQAPARSGNAYR